MPVNETSVLARATASLLPKSFDLPSHVRKEVRQGGRRGVGAVVQGGCAAAILIMSKILISCSSIF